MKKLLVLIATMSSPILPYAYLPDEMSLSDVLLVIAHNSPSSKAYGWRYYQQLGTLSDQWKAGARGAKINLFWRLPISAEKQLAMKAQEAAEKSVATLKRDIARMEQRIKQASNLEKVKLQAKLTGFKVKLKAVELGGAGAGKIASSGSSKGEPYIGLCHETTGDNNCLATATVLKKGDVTKAEDYFREFAQLLEKNPNDVAILFLEDELNKGSEKNGALTFTKEEKYKKLHDILQRSGLAKFAFKLDDTYYPMKGNAPPNWPTVGELRKSGKRIIIFDDNINNVRNSPILSRTHNNPIRRTSWQFDWKKDLQNNKCVMRYDNSGSRGFLVDHGPEASFRQDSKLGKVVGVAKGMLPKIEGASVEPTDYKYVNSSSVIRKRLEQCGKASPGNPPTPPNMLMLDFVEIAPAGEPVYKTIKEINRERAQKRNLSLKE